MLQHFISVARGEEPADILLKNVRLVNVFSGEIYDTSVALYNGLIVGFGDYEAREVVDLEGQYLCPGFIDAHVHLESSMVTVSEFSRTVVPMGTTCVITDPHEIANILGIEGVRYIRDTSRSLPMRVYIMLPSCVPATHMETSGASLTAEDLIMMFNYPRVIGLAEMMNYPGVINQVPEVLAKLEIIEKHPVDGHAPGLSGKDLAAYVVAGIGSDHECTTVEEAKEKLQIGMHIMIRDGTTARNLKSLLPLINPYNSRRCSFCTDDRNPEDLLTEGHINYIVKTAIKEGLDPVMAIQIATINTARYFGLYHLGAVAPGYYADLVVFDNFRDFNIKQVYQKGQKVAEDGKFLGKLPDVKKRPLRSTVNVKWLDIKDFLIPMSKDFSGNCGRVIGIIPDQIITRNLVEKLSVSNGFVISDPSRDLLKIAVIERHMASGNIGLAFVKGFSMKHGAIASSVNHDSHNIIVVGANDRDMLSAVIEVIRMKGGQCVVRDEKVLASLPLPIAGLMSDLPIEVVRDRIKEMTDAAHSMGCILSDPLMTLSFLALPVIPELKLTDKGLVDVAKFSIVPLFCEE
ncbi:MAG TPA: adenine deaminase [Candidatus Eremiobacteraeota bacterium]|nr:adenine deaminase [Candidatus Eremiobacteraeota bacterium]